MINCYNSHSLSVRDLSAGDYDRGNTLGDDPRGTATYTINKMLPTRHGLSVFRIGLRSLGCVGPVKSSWPRHYLATVTLPRCTPRQLGSSTERRLRRGDRYLGDRGGGPVEPDQELRVKPPAGMRVGGTCVAGCAVTHHGVGPVEVGRDRVAVPVGGQLNRLGWPCLTPGNLRVCNCRSLALRCDGRVVCY